MIISLDYERFRCANEARKGVEYSGECYCGKTINAGSALVAGSTPGQTGCNMLCNANRTEYCGGPNRLNMYQAAPVLSNSTTNATTTVVASSTVLATTTAAPTPTGPITVTNLAGYNYLGCYSEGSAGRALIDVQNPYPGANNTVERCAAACSKYTYFGMFTARRLDVGYADQETNRCGIFWRVLLR